MQQQYQQRNSPLLIFAISLNGYIHLQAENSQFRIIPQSLNAMVFETAPIAVTWKPYSCEGAKIFLKGTFKEK